MKAIFVTIFFLAVNFAMLAQTVPDCITAQINKAHGTQQTGGSRKLSSGQTVYIVKVIRPARCMDCTSGTIYYDSTCKTVASFTIGYAPAAYIQEGYNASDFAEASSPIFASRLKKSDNSIPPCIMLHTANSDSLIAAGISAVQEWLIADRHLYYFEPARKNIAGCYDCATTYNYYDELCNLAASFRTGGFAGAIIPSKGFRREDFSNKTMLRVIWSARSDSATITEKLAVPYTTPASFIVTEQFDTAATLFKIADRVTISQQNGLSVYRNEQLLSTYKIIPQKIVQLKTIPCLVPPCPIQKANKIVYFLEPIHRLIEINELPDRAWFNVSKSTYDNLPSSLELNEGDWKTWYRLTKK